jgi:glycosyltransferase involved in cell wall biosynthesis
MSGRQPDEVTRISREGSPDLVSVIVCTHNPRTVYLSRTLEGLKTQTLDTSRWELIVVDNASSPPLAPRIDISWAPSGRIVSEPTPGLTPARIRGIRESTGDLLVFVDDDNVLAPDYLEVAAQTAEQKPFLGSWSGQCKGEFEETPPEWTKRYWGNLVIREFAADTWSNLPRLADSMPCGAGLCVRRSVALHYVELHETGKRRFQLDRTGESLASGGDNDLAACACDIGMGVGLISRLRLTHLIPPERLTADYLARLAEGIYASSTLLDWERGLRVHRRSAGRRLADFIAGVRAGEPHRSILRAAYRGQEKALKKLKEES